MATELTTLTKIERGHDGLTWLQAEFKVLTFFAGKQKGKCLKLQFRNNSDQLNLTREQAQELTLELVKFLGTF